MIKRIETITMITYQLIKNDGDLFDALKLHLDKTLHCIFKIQVSII